MPCSRRSFFWTFWDFSRSFLYSLSISSSLKIFRSPLKILVVWRFFSLLWIQKLTKIILKVWWFNGESVILIINYIIYRLKFFHPGLELEPSPFKALLKSGISCLWILLISSSKSATIFLYGCINVYTKSW